MALPKSRAPSLSFYYQAIGFPTCAVAGIGNLLKLYNIACDRSVIRDWLGLSPGHERLVTHQMILTVVEKQLRSHSLNWRRQKVFSFNSVSRTAKASIEVAGLAFLTFHISHRSKDWAGIHCAIATRVDADGIHLLDSLGRRDRKSPNATILAKKGDNGWPVRGAPTIVTEKSVRFLEGLPSVAEHLK